MRKVIVTEWMSLDGVVQAPMYPDEDRSGGFEYGGWHGGYFDELSRGWIVKPLVEAGAFLFGRGTYLQFAAHWPNASPEEQVLAEPLNTKPKYVASTTLFAPLEWENSTLLDGPVPDAVAKLKTEDEGDLVVIGSPGLTQSLLEYDLVDEIRLMIDPIVIGAGKRPFGSNPAPVRLKLTESLATTTGALLTTYARTTN